MPTGIEFYQLHGVQIPTDVKTEVVWRNSSSPRQCEVSLNTRQEVFLEKEKVSSLERCPHFRGGVPLYI